MSSGLYFKSYFIAERKATFFLAFIGILSLGIAGCLFFSEQPELYKGMVYPLVIIGLLQVVVGIAVSIRSYSDIDRVQSYMDIDKRKIPSVELVRMKKVLSGFKTYKIAQFLMFLSGVVLIFILPISEFWKGCGMVLLIEGMLMLSFDSIAERRAISYTDYLKSYT